MIDLKPQHYEDLIGKPYKRWSINPDEGLDCWTLVALVYSRCGIALKTPKGAEPEILAESAEQMWERVKSGQEKAGDVAGYSLLGKAMDHVGLLLNDGRILHARDCSGVVALRRHNHEKALLGFWRPKPEGQIAESAASVAANRDSEYVLIRLIENMLEPHNFKNIIAAADGSTVREMVPDGIDADALAVTINGGRVSIDTIPKAGDVVTLCVLPGVTATAIATTFAVTATEAALIAFAINTIISIGLSYLVSVITEPPTPEMGGTIEQSPTFSQAGIQNTVTPGRPIPLVIGEHRVGGQIIGTFNTISDLSGEIDTDETLPSGSYVTVTTYGSTTVIDPLTGASTTTTTIVKPQAVMAIGGKTTLNMLLALSEGEVESINGLTGDQNNIPASSLAENTLLIDGNDALDYSDVSISTRSGKVNQTLIPGFSDTINAVSYEQALNKDEVFSHTTTNAVEAFELQMFEPLGHYRVRSWDGELKQKHVTYQFRWRVAGSEFWSEDAQIRRSYVHKGQHSWKIRRDNLGNQKIEISLMRETEDDGSQHNLDNERNGEVSQAIINTVNEITYDATAAPGIALLAVKAMATDQLSGIPTITSTVEGKRWHIWDEVSETSPAFDFSYSTNPSDALAGYLLDRRFGLGHFISLDDLDLASFKTWKEYCNVLIDDGRSGTMKRWEIGAVLDTVQKGSDVVSMILTTGRASLVPLGKKLGIKIDQAETPSHLFGEGNISNLSIGYLDVSDGSRPNRISVNFANAELEYDIDTVTVEDQTVTSSNFNEETVEVKGVTKPARAMRIAKHRLNVSTLLKKTVEFNAPVDAVTLIPGDVFWLSHQSLHEDHVSGRVYANAAAGTIQLDRPVEIKSGTYNVRARATDGTTQVRTISSGTGTYATGAELNISSSWTANPVKGDVYAIGKSTEFLESFRCVECPMSDDLTRTVKGIQYDVGVYSDDPGDVPASTEAIHNPKHFPPTLLNVSATESATVGVSGDVRQSVAIQWQPNNDHEQVKVYVRDLIEPSQTDGTADVAAAPHWMFAGVGHHGRFDYSDVGWDDELEFSVCPMSESGHAKHPELGSHVPFNFVGRTSQPEQVTDVTIGELDTDIVMTWTAPRQRDLDHYEVRVGELWLGAMRVGCVPANSCRAQFPVSVKNGVDYKYHVRPVSTSRIVGKAATSVTHAAAITGTQIATNAQTGGWSGTRTNVTVSGSDIVGDDGQTSLSYQTPQINAGSSGRHYLTTLPTITIEDRTTQTWNLAVYSWGGYGGAARDWAGSALSDNPDSLADANAQQWQDFDSQWQDALPSGRSWRGLVDAQDFKITLKTKVGVDPSAYSAAAFAAYSPQLETFQYFGVLLNVEIPHSDYKVTVTDLQSDVRSRAADDTADAEEIALADSGGYTSEAHVEGALQEIYPAIPSATWSRYISYTEQHILWGGTSSATANPGVSNSTNKQRAAAGVNFSDRNEKGHTFQIVIPPELDVTAVITATVYGRMGAAGSGNMEIEWSGGAQADNEWMGTGATTTGAVVKDVSGHGNNDSIQVALGTVWAADALAVGDFMHMTIFRDANEENEEDTFGDTFQYMGVELRGTRKAAF